MFFLAFGKGTPKLPIYTLMNVNYPLDQIKREKFRRQIL
jgi:hypothetical protein